MRAHGAIALLVLLAACHDGSSPTEPLAATTIDHGRLSGVVTIGPNCPVETSSPCVTPPGAYELRKVLVFNEAGTTLLHTVDIDSQGAYLIDLAPAKYTVDVRKAGIDRASGVPAVVEIKANVVTKLDISIDTGLR
ncbi:MAG TPA: hypothetical protein VI670_19275 [Thermoanaerobaculia bacterium]|jgi:hypothetical protein